jgi:AcrR family transcriptional regulator
LNDPPPAARRKQRADAQRNRERLLAAAKAEFAARGASASLKQIARQAGVGIGTLYRHFPTRDDLIEAIYRAETDRLSEAATQLAETHPPVEALQAWLLLFIDHIETKQGIMEALNSLLGGPSALYASTGLRATAAVEDLVQRAIASGQIRLDMDPTDLLRAIAGVGNYAPRAEWKQAARSLVDLMIAGMRTPPGSA